MQLYYSPLSSNSRKVRMTAALLGVPLELVLVDVTPGKNRAADYLRVNPMGKVPTLIDGDVCLWESHAIMQYLCDLHPGSTMYPTDPASRADVNRWMFWGGWHWQPHIAVLFHERVLRKRTAEADPDAHAVARAEGELARFGKVLDDHLADRAHLCGSAVTLADLALATPLMYTAAARLPVECFANITRWFTPIQSLEVWKQTLPR